MFLYNCTTVFCFLDNFKTLDFMGILFWKIIKSYLRGQTLIYQKIWVSHVQHSSFRLSTFPGCVLFEKVHSRDLQTLVFAQTSRNKALLKRNFLENSSADFSAILADDVKMCQIRYLLFGVDICLRFQAIEKIQEGQILAAPQATRERVNTRPAGGSRFCPLPDFLASSKTAADIHTELSLASSTFSSLASIWRLPSKFKKNLLRNFWEYDLLMTSCPAI